MGKIVRWRIGLAVLACGWAAASLLTAPLGTTAADGPILAGAQIDGRTLAIIRRSCQDCHSENTHYPWYSYAAPVSLLIRNDVQGGRAHLNLSRWPDYPLVRRERALSEIANQVQEREMPLEQYTLIHRNAKMTDADIGAVFRWTQAERSRLIAASAAGAER